MTTLNVQVYSDLVNNRYIERLECHLLISIQTLIFQPQFITQTLLENSPMKARALIG